jgi:hypothetical protein
MMRPPSAPVKKAALLSFGFLRWACDGSSVVPVGNGRVVLRAAKAVFYAAGVELARQPMAMKR